MNDASMCKTQTNRTHREEEALHRYIHTMHRMFVCFS